MFEVSSSGHQLTEALLKQLKQSGLRRNGSFAHRLRESLVHLSQQPGEQGLAAMWKLIAGEGKEVVTLKDVRERFSDEPAEMLSYMIDKASPTHDDMSFDDFKSFIVKGNFFGPGRMSIEHFMTLIQPATEDAQAVEMDYSLAHHSEEVDQKWEQCGGQHKDKITKAEIRQKFQGQDSRDDEIFCLKMVDIHGTGDGESDEITFEAFKAFFSPKPVPEPWDPERIEGMIQDFWQTMVGESDRSTITVQDLGKIFPGDSYQSQQEIQDLKKQMWQNILGVGDGIDDASVKEEMSFEEWQTGMRRYLAEG